MLMLNRKLSEDRGNAVLNWLADNGVDRARLTAKRYGSARLVASNETDSGRQKKSMSRNRTDVKNELSDTYGPSRVLRTAQN
jgi:hypothetical protein